MNKAEMIEIARMIHNEGRNVAARVAEKFEISRQAASAKLASMRKLGLIDSTGTGRGTKYELTNLLIRVETYPVEGLDEDRVWRELCLPMIVDLPENVRNMWQYGITEMVNNAIDHSGSEFVTIRIRRTALFVNCRIEDEGEGIFSKIQRALNLYDPREAILELAKGKFTTDPANHSGEGIFFTSRMFDRFWMSSGELSFCHIDGNRSDFLLTNTDNHIKGTHLSMYLENESEKTTKEVFDRFAVPEEMSFAKTIVPVKLALHEGDILVSRSQAKRLTRRFERFQTVILDFEGVATIGQAFADEIFRVFANAHPDLTMIPLHGSDEVMGMINRARNLK